MLIGKQGHAHDLSASQEHYLRAIWEVLTRHGYARLTDAARELGIAAPTLSVGLRALEQRNLIAHDERRFLKLTASGERLARQIHHRFAVVHTFLHELLGLADSEASLEACRLEHHVSPATTDRVLDLLKLMREDRELRDLFRERFAEYHRRCVPAIECSTCDLACMANDVTPPR
jgi:DtxR family Mn-dependent transcriptional regulator